MSLIEVELAGPSQERRLACLNNLLLDQTLDSNVIRTLIDIENVPSNITVCRDKERYLEDLLRALRLAEQDSEKIHSIAFYHLLGSLYINFEKFWGPTIRVIIDILSTTRHQSTLLQLLLKHLVKTNEYIYCDPKSIDTKLSEDRPDHVLHRNFVFQILSKFPSYVESNCVSFMDQFFIFVTNELMVSPFIERYGRSDLTQQKNVAQDDNETIEEPQKSDDSGRRKRASKKVSKKAQSETILQKRKSRETFITVSKIISSFKDIRRVHRQSELRDLVLELLCCRDSSVQKAAFNCFLAFEVNEIKPYTDKILKILNEKKVRTELSMFSINADESNQVLGDHRKQLIPILQRVLFGRMVSQVGRKSSGRDKADLRKTLVMRFIAGCTVDEILNFFELLFSPFYESFAKVSYYELEKSITGTLNIKEYIPPNKLQAMLDSLEAYMESVAHLREGTLPQVIKLINIITCYIVVPLETPELLNQISYKNVAALKALRRSCLNLAAEFFKSFEYYQFNQNEINFIFKHLIWPSTSGFVDKNHASVTPFLKLVATFANNQAFHSLMVKRNRNDSEDYLLKHIIDLYQDQKTDRPVIKFLASMIADLLDPKRHLIDDDDQPKNEDLMVVDLPAFQDEDARVPNIDETIYNIHGDVSSIPYGHSIVLAFIPAILDRLRRTCQIFIEKKGTNQRIENDELSILSMLSGYLIRSEESLLATNLLLSTLEHQKNNALILNTLRTAQSLMRQVEKNTEPAIIMNVANMLGYQRNAEQRNELCNFIDVLAANDVNLQPVNSIIRLMNATCEDLVDLPDLTKWSEGFRLSFEYFDKMNEQLITDPSLMKDSLILLIHQTGFIINTIDRYDFSVRENCYLFYEKLSEKLKLVDDNDFIQLIIDDILLDKFIRKGMRDTNDAIKHTFIEVLRVLTVNCHDKHTTLREFHLFCHSNQDLDFWKNIKHIQLHTRSKALARLISNENLEKVSPKTLSAYFLPIAAGFLFNKTYKTVGSLTENSIKLIGIICKHLNWITYESTLGYYLGLLTKANATYQKTNIKLITEIIKNFSFDLTNCEEAMQYEEENKKLEKRMMKRLGQKVAEDSEKQKYQKLNPSTARMVYNAITKRLIPRLTSCLHEMTRVEFEHDKNMSNYVPEKDEIKRVPIAFAIVQLLSLLPGRYVLFRDHLPALFLKLVSFLKSKNQETRKAARMTIIRIMTFEPVGPAYLPDLLRILKQNLDKGFHVHVLNYTIHSVLDKLRLSGLLHYGDLDGSAHELVDSCLHEIFGRISEDKEIAQIIAKTFEAKKTKSYDTLLILASYISAEKLTFLVDAIKSQLKVATETKKVNKLSVCLQRVFTGLSQNEDFPITELLTFIQSTIEDSIPSLRVRRKIDVAENTNDRSKMIGPHREDRYLIGKEKTRERVKSKINEKGNLHMVIENSLRLLLLSFEKYKAEIKRKETLQRKLDGFIVVLTSCLKSSSPGCVMRSLKCIHFIAQTKPDLPSFKTKCNSIVKKIFVLLSLYNGVGMVQGENYEMIVMCFKTVTLLLLRCDHVKLDDDQIRALMAYIAQDLADNSRQNTAFNTLYSLLQRKCESPELAAIMNKIADLLVTSSDDTVRNLAIKCWQTYLLDYKHEGNNLQIHLTKFLRQIDYEHIDGRKSVIRMLRIVIEKFPERILRDHLELFFHLLAQRIVNDESKEVRNNIGRLIALLVQRLPDNQVYIFNKFVIPWACGNNMGLKILGIKLISIYLEACKVMFENDKDRITKLLDIVCCSLGQATVSPGSSKENEHSGAKSKQNSEKDESSKDESVASEFVRLLSVSDKLVYHSLRMFKRLLDKELISCIENRYIAQLKKIWQKVASDELSHWHDSIVLTSCQLYHLFITTTGLRESLKVEYPITDNYLDWNATRIVRLLCDKYIELLDRYDQTSNIYNYIVEGLVTLAQMVANSATTLKFEEKYLNSFQDGDVVGYMLDLEEIPNDGFVHDKLPYSLSEAKKQANLMWLSIKIIMQARKEAALFRLSKTYRRDFVLKWTAAVAQELGPRRIAPYVLLFSMTPVRELTDKIKSNAISVDDGTSFRNIVVLSEDLLKFLKSLTGVELFNKIYSKVQLHYARKRVDRKKQEALLKVRDQARGVKRKIKQHREKDVKRRQTKSKARKAIVGRDIRSK